MANQSNVANQCNNCSKQFLSKHALKQHTGAKTAGVRKQHVCKKCDQIFCSERAMQQHHDSPSHDTMFKCVPCKRNFGDKRALAQHNQDAKVHARIKAVKQQTATRSPQGAQTVGSVLLAPEVNKNEGSRSDLSNLGDDWNFDEDSDESSEYGSGPYAYRYNRNPYYSGTGYDYERGEDYGLCDKDCGWCGHCMDGVDV